MVSFASGQISTIAGTGTASYTGDNAAATAATLNTPSGIALDGAGNLYIADTGNNVIRRVDAVTQVITTVAGNGSGLPGFGGDGSLATSGTVLLDGPQGIAVDAAGDLYIADTNNQVVREVSAATGDINTVAGEYFGPFGNGVGGYNGDGELATAATLNRPYAVAFDAAGDALIADAGNNRIREINATTLKISTMAGDGVAGATGDNAAATSAELDAPTGIALDPAGDLYIGDTQNNRIRKVNAASGDINTLAVSGGEYLLDADSIANTIAVKGPQGPPGGCQRQRVLRQHAEHAGVGDREQPGGAGLYGHAGAAGRRIERHVPDRGERWQRCGEPAGLYLDRPPRPTHRSTRRSARAPARPRRRWLSIANAPSGCTLRLPRRRSLP